MTQPGRLRLSKIVIRFSLLRVVLPSRITTRNNEVEMKKQIFLIGTVAALSAFAPQASAQDVEVKAEVDKPKATTRTEAKTDKDLEVKADANIDRDRVLKA